MKILPLLFVLCGCAALKPLPTQTLDCVKAEASAGNAVKAATCIAQGGSASTVETCYLGIAEGVGLDLLQCEALALWGDLHHAATVSAATGIPVATVQLNAVNYLQAKDSASAHP